MAAQVFISYSTIDRLIAERVYATLESRGMQCWVAPRDIPAGAEWADAIVEALDDSRVLVLVFSLNSNDSPQVVREIGRAVSNKIPVITLRIDDAAPSRAMQFYTGENQWLDAREPPLEKHIHTLAETVEMLLTQQYDEAPAQSVEESQIEERGTDETAGIAETKEEPAGAIRGVTRSGWVRTGMVLLIVGVGWQLFNVLWPLEKQLENRARDYQEAYLWMLAIGLPVLVLGALLGGWGLSRNRLTKRSWFRLAAALLSTGLVLIFILTGFLLSGGVAQDWSLLLPSVIGSVFPFVVLGGYCLRRGIKL